ncbi:VWA domain-containing protein [Mucisphaera calidilacus]|uniref:von Willebrand factor type A domain protein n=1 Tax=Mucisphaera calidilacus TaxID=2527982 RepID=A0A518BU87_9BACT|nr:VWA domain-containing protein [Mucisphaera calidilacus]QDU70504.1 von Willebrand factor type A domain protein [Mucisphaera calidilacus]
MWLAAPVWLCLLLLSALPAAWWWRRGSSQRWRIRPVLLLIVRCVVILALALAAAGPRWLAAETAVSSAVILTTGSDAAEIPSEPSIRVTVAEGDLRIEPASRWNWSRPPGGDDGTTAFGRERPGDVLAVASALLPPGASELWMPENWIAGLDLSLHRLPAEGIRLRGYGDSAGEALRLVLDTPNNALPGSEIVVSAMFDGGVSEGDELLVRVEGVDETRRSVTLVPERASFPVRLTAPERPGLYVLAAEHVDVRGNIQREARAAMVVLEPMRISVVGHADQAEAIADSVDRLRSLWGASALVTGRRAEGLTASSLKQVQLVVVLSGQGAQTQAVLAEAARDGVGLLALAGPEGLPGRRDPLAGVLPAYDRQTIEQRDPSVSLVIIIDTSGSMGGARMPLAKQVAEFAIRRLMPHDRVGIVEFYGSRRWAAPLQPASNQIEIKRGLHRLTPGGGTIILPAVDEAYYALLNTRTRFKHVLILTDGGVETGPFREKIERMRRAGITTSTVLVGPAQHSQFLTSLAQWGGGHAYQAPDRFRLPEIVLKQIDEQMQSPPGGSESQAQFRGSGSRPIGLTAPVNPEDAMRLEKKPTGHISATIDGHQPLAVHWRYGRGRAGVWAGSLTGPLANSVYERDETARWLRQWMSSLAAPQLQRRIAIDTTRVELGLSCDLRWTGGKPLPADDALILRCLDREGRIISQTIPDVMSPGRWSGRLLVGRTGSFRLEALTPGAEPLGVAGLWMEEHPGRMAHEQVITSPASADVAPTPWRVVDPTLWLMVLAWLGVLSELAIRRFSLPGRLRSLVARERAGSVVPSALICCMLTSGVIADSMPEGARAEATLERAEQVLIDSLENDLDLDEQIVRLVVSGERHIAIALADEAGLSGRCIDLALEARRLGEAGVAELTILARHLQATGRPEEAGMVLEEALAKAAPEERTALLLHLYALSPETQSYPAEDAITLPDEAGRRWVGHYLAFRGHHGRAIGLLNDLETPGAQDLMTLAEVERRAGNPSVAMEVLRRAEQHAERRRDRQSVALMQFQVAVESGREGELIKHWLVQRPIPSERFWPLITLLRQTGQSSEVIDLIAEAARPSDQGVLRHDANMLRRELFAVANAPEARGTAIRAIEQLALEQGSSLWQACLGQVLALDGRRDLAAEAFLEAARQARGLSERLWCAEAADASGCHDAAEAILLLADQGSDKDRLRVGLTRATHQAQHSSLARALETLDGLAGLVGDDGDARRLADAYIEIGQPDRAIDLLSERLGQGSDRASAQRLGPYLAWLHTQRDQPERARAIWLDLWENALTPALRQRAEQQLLELSAQTAELGSLAVDMESRVHDNPQDRAARSMLVALYARIDDPVSATEVLLAPADDGDDAEAAREKLIELYLKTGRLRLADDMLGQLIAIDPDRALDYWQQRTVIAAERGDLYTARHAIEQIGVLGELPPARLNELAAGILAMLGDSGSAADRYRLTLLKDPQQVELWLLWGRAMQDAGRGQQAITRLLRIVDQAEEDDLFLVGVDGLLNLDAPPALLEVALRYATVRAAKHPDRAYLLRSVVDLHEALGDTESALSWINPMLIAAGDRSATLLREGVERSRALGRSRLAAVYGQSLIATGYAVPPQVMIDLGDMLLDRHDERAADRAFQRAIQFGEKHNVVPQVAKRYEKNLRPEVAQRLIQELLLIRPDDVSLLYRQGSLYTQLGRWEEAQRCFIDAVGVLLARMPIRASDEPRPNLLSTRRRRVAGDLSEIQTYFGPCVEGAIFCSLNEPDRARALREFQRLAEQAGDLSTGLYQAGDRADRFPRWLYATDALRFAALAMNQAEASRSGDEVLIATFAESETVTARIERMRHAFHPSEVVLAEDTRETALLLSEQALRQGDKAETERRLERLTEDSTAWDTEHAVRAALLGLATQRRDLTARATLSGLESLLDDRAAQRSEARFRQLMALGWHALEPADQRSVIDRLRHVAEQGQEASWVLAWLRTRSWQSVDAGRDERMPGWLIDAVTRDDVPAHRLVAMINLLGQQQAGSILELAWERRDPSERWSLLRAVAAGIAGVPTPALRDTLSDLVERTPVPTLDKFRPYTMLSRGGWSEQPAGAELAMAMSGTLLGLHPEQPAVMVIHAQACHAAGGRERLTRASQLARDAMRQLATQTTLTTDQVALAEAAQPLLLRADVGDWLDQLELRRAQGLAAVNELLMASMAAAGVGMETSAAELALEAFARVSGEPVVRNWLVDLLMQTHRFPAMADVLWPLRDDRSVIQQQTARPLSQALQQLGSPERALQIASIDERTLGAIEALPLRASLGQHQSAEQRLLQYLNQTQLERRFYTPRMWSSPTPGGIVGYRQDVAERLSERRTLWEELAPQPFAYRLYQARLSTATPDRNDVPGLIEGLADAAVAAGRTQELVEELTARIAQQDEPDLLDLRLLAATASRLETPDAAAGESLAAWLGRASNAPDDARIAQLLKVLPLNRPERAELLKRWLLARQRAGLTPRVISVPEPIDTHDLGMILQPTPVDVPSSTLLRLLSDHAAALTPDRQQQLLDQIGRWTEIASASLAASELLRLETRLATLRGEWEVVEERLGRLLNSTHPRVLPADPELLLHALPPAATEQLGTLLLDRLADPDQPVRGGEPSRLRLACLLSTSIQRHVSPTASLAESALSFAEALRPAQPSSDWLYVIDAAREIRPERSERLSLEMAEAGVLPPSRFTSLRIGGKVIRPMDYPHYGRWQEASSHP